MIFLFWISLIILVYTYFGYPMLLMCMRFLKSRDNNLKEIEYQPSISLIIPAFNEEKIIKAKIENTLSLKYPENLLKVLVVSDGSTDNTEEIVRQYTGSKIKLIAQPERQGKAAALNAGLNASDSDIIVFSDTSIMLDSEALGHIVAPFKSPEIGCVSGEDHISGSGGEGLYGQYELFLRNQESRVYSVVGASGCFYAQRRSLCQPFIEGMAPDFLSVLVSVEKGFLAVTQPSAIGHMKSVAESSDEYSRKLRTFIRGMTTLMNFNKLLNPLKYGFFSIELISHKLLRWFSGLFLIALLVSNIFLFNSRPYAIFCILQLTFYCLALFGWVGHDMIGNKKIFKIPFYFCMVNISALNAWIKYLKGIRQEIWEPSRR